MGEYDGNTRAAIDRARKTERDRRLGRMSGQDKELAVDLLGNGIGGEAISGAVTRFYKAEELTPSQWFRGSGLLKFFVPEEFAESFLYIVDKLNRFPFSVGWNRRTVRTARYGPCVRQAFLILMAYENLGY